MKSVNITNPNTFAETRGGRFWQEAFPVILFHTLAVWAFCGFVIYWQAHVYHALIQELASSHDVAFILRVVAVILVLPLMLASSLIATIAFLFKRQGRKAHKLLLTYVCLQLGVGLLLTSPIWPEAGITYFVSWYKIKKLAQFLTIYFILFSIPLQLLLARWIWSLVATPVLLIDSKGRFLACVGCGYDLRGTPGPTCPECGESVMADEKQADQGPSIAAD